MLSIKAKTPPDVASELAGRVKTRRLELNLTQAAFAAKAGLKLPTYRLFDFCQINAKRRGERKSCPVAVGAEDRWCGILSAS